MIRLDKDDLKKTIYLPSTNGLLYLQIKTINQDNILSKIVIKNVN